MRVKVLYFAMFRDALGGEEWLDLPAGAHPDDVKLHVSRRAPQLAGLLPSLRVAINQAYAAWDSALKDGDEIALIPPVAGG